MDQRISDGYIIPMAAMILSAGVFGDLHGRRRVHLLGMALTAIGTTIAALGSGLGGAGVLHTVWAGQASRRCRAAAGREVEGLNQASPEGDEGDRRDGSIRVAVLRVDAAGAGGSARMGGDEDEVV